MYVVLADLDEDRTGLGEQFTAHDESVTQIAEVRIDTKFPSVPIGLYLFRLASRVFRFAVRDIPLARRDLPIRAKRNAVWRVQIDHLHLATHVLFLGK